MAEATTDQETFERIGGSLCLDFANSVNAHASDHPQEWLTHYAKLVAWSRSADIVTDHQAQRLLRRATRRPAEAEAVLVRAITLREAIYRIFTAIVHGRAPKAADLAELNARLSEALSRSQIMSVGEGFAWDWAGGDEVLDGMLWPIARSAADLLTSEALQRVGQCADEGCGWLFLDTSKNHSRRWCDMKSCGNQAKARRHYERKRKAQSRK